MNISSAVKYAFGVTAAAAFLAGCSSGGGSQSQFAPSGRTAPMAAIHRPLMLGNIMLTSAEMPKRLANVARVAPDRKRHHRKFWYIASFYDSTVNVYTLPGLVSKGTLSGTSEEQGLCTKGTGTFWVANSGGDDLLEYDYKGTTVIKTLTESVGEPAGCSVDPTTGNVAMSVLFDPYVLVWTGGTGTYTQMDDSLSETWFVAYDGSGDLFANGYTTSGAVGLAELTKGSTTWKTLSLNQTIGFPGGIQWDGKYLAYGDQSLDANALYRFSCSGSSCTNEGTVSLTGSEDCDQGWIKGGVFACGDVGDDEGKLYHYPAGGSPYADVSGLDGPLGGTIVK